MRGVGLKVGAGRRIALSGLIVALGSVVLAVAVNAAEAQKAAPEGPRAEMDAVFDAITHLLPLAMDADAWADPAMRADILKWIERLDSRTGALVKHGEKRDSGFQNLSRSLAEDISEIRVRYELERYEEARYYMMEATGNCVACHSRMPSSTRFKLANKLLDRIDETGLEPHERAHLLVITRQFERSLDTWEAILADPSVPAAQISASGYLLDYLIIAVRVQQDPNRAMGTLKRFSQREDVPRYVARDINGWLGALDASGGELKRKPSLKRARKLVEGEVGPRQGLLGREQTIYDLVASTILLQLIDQSKAGDPKSAEAYYLLGLIEARSVDSFWVPQAEFHLEISIRLDPDASFAEDAYAALEECIAIGYGGALGEDLPTDVEIRLRELRGLLDDVPVPKTEVRGMDEQSG